MAEQSLELVLKARYDAGGIATAAKGLSSSLDAMRRREFDVSHDARERELRDVDEYYLKVRARAESQSKRLIEAETNVLTRQFEAGVAGKPTADLDRQFAALQAHRARVEETLQQANISQELQRTALRERRTAGQLEQWGADTAAAQAPDGGRGFLTRGLARVAGPAAAIGISAAAVAAVAQAQRAREEIRSAHEDGNRFAELRARQALNGIVADFHARIPLIGGAIKTAMDAWGDRAGIDKLIGNLESASGRIQQMQLAIRAATAQGAAGIGGGLPGSFGLIMRSGATRSQMGIDLDTAKNEAAKADAALRRAKDIEDSEERRIAVAEADKQRGLAGGIAAQRRLMLEQERERSGAEVGVARREEAAAVTRSLGERAFAQETADATPENARRRELHNIDRYLNEQTDKYAKAAEVRQQLERQVTHEAEMEAARRLQGMEGQFPGLRAEIVATESARIRATYAEEFKALDDLEREAVNVRTAGLMERAELWARLARQHREAMGESADRVRLTRMGADDTVEGRRAARLAEIDVGLQQTLRQNRGVGPEAVETRAALEREAEARRFAVGEDFRRQEEAAFRSLAERRADAEAGASRDVMRIRDREIEKLRNGYDEQIRLAAGNAGMIAAIEATRDAETADRRTRTDEEDRRRRTGIEIEVLRAGGQTLAAREKEIGEKYAEMRRQAGGNASELASIAGLERRDLALARARDALARARDANPVTREVGMIESRFLRNAPGFDDPALRTTEELRKANDILGQIAKSLAGGTRLTVRTVSLRGA